MKNYILILILLATPWYLGAQSTTIGTGASMTIGVGSSVSVGTASSSGTLTNTDNTRLIIESSSSGSGSLICGGSPSATVQSYITPDEWHLVSPITNSTTVDDYHFNYSPRSWLIYFDESSSTNGDYVYMTELTDAVNVYQGYSFYVETTAQTVQYTGNLTSSDKTLNTTPTPALSYTDASHGWNLIGNPFPCALDFDGTWSRTNVDNNVWVWDDSFGNYLAYSPNAGQGTLTDGVIPMGQGFFIHASAGSPEFTIPASARVHSSQAFYKSSNIKNTDSQFVRFDFANNEKQDVIIFAFADEATSGFDSGFDARKFFGPETSPQAYFVDAGMDLSIDGYDINNGEYISVPIGYIPGTDGIQQLSATLNNLENIEVEIEDKQLDIFYTVSENTNISFNSSKSDDPNRFVLHFNRNASRIENTNEIIDVQVFSYKDRVFINLGKSEHKEIKVFINDLMGRNIYKKTFFNHSNIEIPMESETEGYYVVTTIVSNKVNTSKVLLKK